MNIHFSKSTWDCLQDYLKQKGRVNARLTELAKLFKRKHKGIKYLTQVVKDSTNPTTIFKILLLLHFCYLDAALEPTGALKILELMRYTPKEQNSVQEKLCEQVLPHYRLYLQKCYKALQQNRSDAKSKSIQQQLYMKLNLLSLGVSFINIVYTIGRYFQHQYGFMPDFNVVVARDTTILYDRVKSLLKADLQLFQTGVKDVLQTIHEAMYVVYYNCYYYQYSKKYEPIWIQLNPRQQKNQHQHQQPPGLHQQSPRLHQQPSSNTSAEQRLNREDSNRCIGGCPLENMIICPITPLKDQTTGKGLHSTIDCVQECGSRNQEYIVKEFFVDQLHNFNQPRNLENQWDNRQREQDEDSREREDGPESLIMEMTKVVELIQIRERQALLLNDQ